MKQRIAVLLICLAAIVSVAAIDPRAVIVADEQQTQREAQAEDIYSCPMHTEVTTNKPGKCTICGMNLVKKDTSQNAQTAKPTAHDKIAQAKKLLHEAKQALGAEGKYKCCIEEGCDRCALDHQSCPCYADLKADKPVCPDCYAGWQRGEGKDTSIKPSDVKTKFSDHKH